MPIQLSEELEIEAADLLHEIYEAFATVSRKGGVSWHQTTAIDGYGSLEDQKKARRADRDTQWQDLVEDPHWWGYGEDYAPGWSFLDAIGFRYYLPPAMVRSIQNLGQDLEAKRIQVDEMQIAYILVMPQSEYMHRYTLKKWSIFDRRQLRCIQRYLWFMTLVGEYRAETETEAEEPWAVEGLRQYYTRNWLETLDSYWGNLEVDGPQKR